MLLPSPRDFKEKFTLFPSLETWVNEERSQLSAVLQDGNQRIALACGPCSLHSQESALEFGKKLMELQEEVKDRYYLVMRAYIEKPRTSTGWKGKLYGMAQEDQSELLEGLMWSRETLLKLTEARVPLAIEFLDPIVAPYFDDLITWGFIGSRTSLSQIHRQLASSLPFPVGFKNTPDGSILSAINAIHSAQESHLFFHIDEEGRVCSKKSAGNPRAHLVLRGSDSGPNYEPDTVVDVLKELDEHNLPRCLVIDCSHGNSQKIPHNQRTVFESVMEQWASGSAAIRGTMLECHLESGSQPFSLAPSPTLSMTDPCLSFDQTADLLLTTSTSKIH